MINQLSFFGLGKLGLPLAALFARAGVPTLGIDADARLIDTLKAGQVPHAEPGLAELLIGARPMLAFAHDARGAAETDASIILVATPSDSSQPEYSSAQVEQACRDLCAALSQRPVWHHHLIVISSTMATGAIGRRIVPLLERTLGRRAGHDFSVAYVPEFVALGQVLLGFQSPPFLLVGADDEQSGSRATALYRRITDPATPSRTLTIRDAELAKVASNTFLPLKISFANFLAQLGDRLGGADIDAIAGVLCLDPRIGSGLLRAGTPYGGPCLPRDVDALAHLAQSLGVASPLTQATAAVNSAQYDLILQHVLAAHPRCVAVIGLAFKPGTPVITASPSITLIKRLNEHGIAVVAYDPSAEARAKTLAVPGIVLSCRDTLEEACAAADTILICHADPEFERIASLVPHDGTIVDPWGVVPDSHPGLVRIGRPSRLQGVPRESRESRRTELTPGDESARAVDTLTIAQLVLPDLAGHYFNELLGYKAAAHSLGLTPKIFVPRATPPGLAEPHSLKAVLDPPAEITPVHDDNTLELLDACFEAGCSLDAFWSVIAADGVTRTDLVLFPLVTPSVIFAVARWLGQRPVDERPAVFLRFVGPDFLDQHSGRFNARALQYHLASKDLRTRPGADRVFFLANSTRLASAITRMSGRRTFLMPLPKYLDVPAATRSAISPSQPVIYVHLNVRSGSLMGVVVEVVRRVRADMPAARFLVKAGGDVGSAVSALQLEPELSSAIEVIPAEQNPQDYLAALNRSTIILLAYEAHEYTYATSGVFAEGVALGKVMVVPEDTWMAGEITAGRAAGVTFGRPTAESVAEAFSLVWRDMTALEVAARQRASPWRHENSCRRNLEIMRELAPGVADMDPRYHIGDEIDFGDHFDCRDFMGAGWGPVEPWGVWTIGSRAELVLRLEASTRKPLQLRAWVLPFLHPDHRSLAVRVSINGERVSKWTFQLGQSTNADSEWREAPLAIDGSWNDTGELRIAFDIEAPMSPCALGLSQDRRLLGLGLRRLTLEPQH